MAQNQKTTRKRTPRASEQKSKTTRATKRRVSAVASNLNNPVVRRVHRGLLEGGAILLGFISFYLLMTLITFDSSDPGWSFSGQQGDIANVGGRVGAFFADVTLYLVGYVAFLIPLMVAFSAFRVFRERKIAEALPVSFTFVRWLGFIVTLGTGCGLTAMHFAVAPDTLPLGASGGGVLGSFVSGKLTLMFGELGATLGLLALFLVGITLFSGLSWFGLMDAIGALTIAVVGWVALKFAELKERYHERAKQREAERAHREKLKAAADKKKQQEAPKISTPAKAPAPKEDDKAESYVSFGKKPKVESVAKPVISDRAAREKQIKLFVDHSDSELPPLALLDAPQPQEEGYSKEQLESMSRLLEEKLKEFNVIIKVVEVHPGPVITRFEIEPAPGVKVSQIVNLAKDIARSLSIVSVRVVEVIAGKSTIGLEIPNEKREMVQLSEIIQSRLYDKAASPLTLAMGKDIGGSPVVADLAKMPHCLVAGTTGSGKSVAVNAMLLSLLYKAKPDEVKMILIDPKMLELNVYEGVPHLLAPVVTDMKEAANALRWAVGEMERRYRLMASLGVRNIVGFNRKVKEAIEAGEPIPDPTYKKEEAFDPEAPAPTLEPLPYIVVVVDEFADMIMVVGKKVEELIARIAQKARAAGIHLVLATQRPSVDVITGLIKANIPTRMAFQVSSKVDSRTILDQVGAEMLLGHGDMLFLPPGTSQPIRVHGAFVDDHEVHKVVEHLKAQGEAVYIDEILEEPSAPIPGLSADASGSSDAEKDALYDQAVAIVTESRKASISYVQRRLKIGYNRAARMVEEMEEAGVVSAVQSNGSREVLAPPPPKD